MQVTRKCSYSKILSLILSFQKIKMVNMVLLMVVMLVKINNSKILEKVYCEICKIYITKLHLKDHTKSERHRILVQLNKYSSTPLKS